MVDLVGCHIREVLKGSIISLAEMLGFVRLVARAGFNLKGSLDIMV